MPGDALALYWEVSGTYLREAFEAHEDVRALQVPLFDPDALARAEES
jgi:hypothetical protein